MNSIICKNKTETIIKELQDYIQKNGILKGIALVDQTNEQVAILVSSEKKITQEFASVWWDGFTTGLGGKNYG